MAIALDSSGTVQFPGYNQSSLTFAHTCTGSNLILFVTTEHNRSLNSITGVTYAGVSMTSVAQADNASNASYTLWYLVAPATGANNVVITCGGLNNIIGYATSYTGANQTGQPDAFSSTNDTTTTSFSMSVTTVADNCWAIWAAGNNAGPTITAGTHTRVLNQPEVSVAGTFNADSNGVFTPAGTATMTVTGSSTHFAGVMASFSPVVPSQILTASGIAQASISSANGVPAASIKTITGITNV